MRSDSIDKALLYVVWAGVFLLLFMPLVVTTETIYPFIVGKAFYARILIALMFGAWSWLAFRNPLYRVRPSWLLGLLGIYFLVSLAAGIFGISFQRSLWSTFERMQGIVDLAHWLVLIMVLSSVIRDGTGWRYIFNVNLAVSVIIALVGVAQSLGVSNLPIYSYLQADERIGITLGNPAFVSAYLMVNVLIGLGLVLQSFEQRQAVSRPTPSSRRRRRRRTGDRESDTSLWQWRLFWVAAAALDLWVITLTGTRGAAMGLVLGLLTFAVGYFVFGQWKAVKIGLAGMVVLMVLTGLGVIFLASNPLVDRLASSNILIERISDVSPNQVSFKARLLTLSVGAKAFAERPILGWGPENYLIPFGRYYTEGSEAPETLDQAHNKPVEELVTKGAIGLLSFGSFWAYAYITLFRRMKHMNQSSKIFVLGILAALTGYFVQNLFLFDTPATFLQFAIIIAFVVYLDAQDSENSTELEVGKLPKQGATPSSRESTGRSESASAYLAVQLRKLNVFANGVYAMRLRWLGLGLSTVIVLSSLILNTRIVYAATIALNLTEGERGVSQILEALDDTVSAFPPLANYPRLILFDNVSGFWPALSQSEKDLVLTFVDAEAKRALRQEPQNWRINMSLAKMYEEIADQSPGYMGLDLARSYIDETIQLAPERLEIRPILLKIEKMERKQAER